MRTIIALGGLANRCALSGIATVTSPADVRSALLRQSRSAGIESAAADHEEMPARVLVNVERLPRQIFPDVGFDGAFGIFGDFLHITRRNADVRDFDSAASAYAFLGKHTGFRQRHCDREIGSDRIAGDFPRIGVEPEGMSRETTGCPDSLTSLIHDANGSRSSP